MKLLSRITEYEVGINYMPIRNRLYLLINVINSESQVSGPWNAFSRVVFDLNKMLLGGKFKTYREAGLGKKYTIIYSISLSTNNVFFVKLPAVYAGKMYFFKETWDTGLRIIYKNADVYNLKIIVSNMKTRGYFTYTHKCKRSFSKSEFKLASLLFSIFRICSKNKCINAPVLSYSYCNADLWKGEKAKAYIEVNGMNYGKYNFEIPALGCNKPGCNIIILENVDLKKPSIIKVGVEEIPRSGKYIQNKIIYKPPYNLLEYETTVK